MNREVGNKSLKKNYIYNLSYQLLALLLPLITTPYISRVLGASGVGVYSYTTAIVSYFVLIANLGTSYYGSREIAYVRDNVEERSKVFWEVVLLRVFTTVVCLIAYVLFLQNSEYKTVFYAQIPLILAVIFDVTWFFTGIEEFGVTVLRNTIVKLFSVIYVFTVVKSANDTWLYVLGVTAASLLGNISFWFQVPKYIVKIPFQTLRPLRNIKVIIQLFIPYIATQIYTTIDKTMIGAMTSTSVENGYYEQAEKIAKMLLTILTTMGTVMVPRFAYLYKKNLKQEMNSYLRKGFSFAWMFSIPLCLGLIAISNSFVPWFFGDGFEAVSPLLKIFSFLIIAIGLSNILGSQYLIPTERQNIYTFTVIAGAIINVILNFLFIPKYLSVGAAIASVSAESLIAFLQIIYLRKEIGARLIFSTAKNYAISGLIMFFVCYPLGKILPLKIYGTLIVVLIGCAVYFLMLFLLKDRFVLSYWNAIIQKIKKR